MLLIDTGSWYSKWKTCFPHLRSNGMIVASFLFVMSLLSNYVEPLTTSPPLNKKPLKAILFDIDGTLVNTDPIHFAVFRELLVKVDGFNDGRPIDEDYFRRMIAGRSNALIMTDFFPHWSITEREAWADRKESLFRDVAESTMMNNKTPGLDNLRTWIEDHGLKKAAVTNAPRLNAEAMLSGIGYDEWFGVANLIVGDECERPKPDPCPYLKACKILDVCSDEKSTSAEHCIVFEDSPSGARAGVAAGAFVIGILSGQEESTLREAGCQLIISDFNDPKLWDYLNNVPIASCP